MLKKIYTTISLLLISGGIIMAQSIEPFVIASTGNFSGTTFTLSSTLGEVMVTTETGTNNILTQGFQQPSVVGGTSIQQIDENGTLITVYPNPAIDHLTVEISSDQYDRFDIELFDLPGQEIFVRYEEEQYSTTNIYTINTSALAPGIYLLRITSYNNELQKVIKFNKHL